MKTWTQSHQPLTSISDERPTTRLETGVTLLLSPDKMLAQFHWGPHLISLRLCWRPQGQYLVSGIWSKVVNTTRYPNSKMLVEYVSVSCCHDSNAQLHISYIFFWSHVYNHTHKNSVSQAQRYKNKLIFHRLHGLMRKRRPTNVNHFPKKANRDGRWGCLCTQNEQIEIDLPREGQRRNIDAEMWKIKNFSTEKKIRPDGRRDDIIETWLGAGRGHALVTWEES